MEIDRQYQQPQSLIGIHLLDLFCLSWFKYLVQNALPVKFVLQDVA